MNHTLVQTRPNQTHSKPNLSIIIPAYKEAEMIKKTINNLKKFLKSRSHYGETEVIISVGTSSDDTLKIARQETKNDANFTVIDAGDPHDKGHNVKVGMQHADGHKKVYMDADLATPLHHLDRTVELLDEYDVVNGQRDLNNIHGEQWHRKLMSKAGNRLIRTILLPGFKDTQCGFKGFRSSVADDLFDKQTILRWGFDMELLALARDDGATIKHLPINDWKDMEGGVINESKLKAAKASFYTLADLVKIRFLLATGYYNQPNAKS